MTQTATARMWPQTPLLCSTLIAAVSLPRCKYRSSPWPQTQIWLTVTSPHRERPSSPLPLNPVVPLQPPPLPAPPRPRCGPCPVENTGLALDPKHRSSPPPPCCEHPSSLLPLNHRCPTTPPQPPPLDEQPSSLLPLNPAIPPRLPHLLAPPQPCHYPTTAPNAPPPNSPSISTISPPCHKRLSSRLLLPRPASRDWNMAADEREVEDFFFIKSGPSNYKIGPD